MIQTVVSPKRYGPGGWNKRTEWDFRELVKLSNFELLKLGKRYKGLSKKKLDPKDKLYRFWLEACLAIVLKSMPSQKAKEFEEDTPEQLPFIVRLNGISNTAN